jgi:hypothetical protein
MNHLGRSLACVSACLICATPGIARAQSGDSFGWSITPYIWGSQTKLDLSYKDRDIASSTLKFSELLDIMDGAFMIHGEGGRGSWSAFADLTYIELSDTDKRQVATIKSSSEQIFLDAALAYWPGGFGSPLSIFGGLRYTGLDDEFKFEFPNLPDRKLRSNKDYTDALLGIRYRFDLSERWSLLTHGDVSFGDSEGTWLLRALFGYTVGERRMNRILFGYQYKQADFKDGHTGLDLTYQGPMAGFNFRF